ncbi:hypothetical protein JMJ77_0007436 [Colletotrichum scovillei]|uniref:Uncharacterized protein n=1 Tax=Colletotrichum scovillei TaxID=1209932 RepID=A0A9P7RCT8_9PEZI|nr:hypothetical protein JMJ77_0007436 [Colletotrichum scovillei]KAG7074410.1 hypothetical protein JMJ76_0010890 [Colletotrichum scovillei]KAG7081377.1 hypothetical protein JMJ78_0003500 [Colletotrichum scovillei]
MELNCLLGSLCNTIFVSDFHELGCARETAAAHYDDLTRRAKSQRQPPVAQISKASCRGLAMLRDAHLEM